jgi:DNA anti-recombination protein RmuC
VREREWAAEREQARERQRAAQKAREERARAEARNMVDGVKSEMARARVEGERDRKRLLQEFEDRVEHMKREAEERLAEEVKATQNKHEKNLKKRLEEVAKEH